MPDTPSCWRSPDHQRAAASCTGCGTQRPFRTLNGAHVLLAAAPTTAPCFRRRRRSPSLHGVASSCRSIRRCLPKVAFRLYTRSLCQKARWSFSFAFTLPGRTKPVIRAFPRRIDISECTFFALLIYQFTIPKKCFVPLLLFHIVCNDITSSNEMFTKLLQNLPIRPACITVFYAKRRSIQVAQFFG